MPYRLEHSPDTHAVTAWIDGDLVVRNRQDFKQAVLDTLDQGARALTVDLSACGYLDTSGLGVLVTLRKRFLERGGTMALRGINPDLADLFELTQMTRVFTILPSLPPERAA